jgi:hypothetical protein
MRKLVLAVVLTIAAFIVTQSLIGLLTPKRVWETVGPVQVLTDGRDTWVFFQFDRWKHRPGLLVSALNIVFGHRQGVLQLSSTSARTYWLANGDGPSFSPRLSCIFHHEGHFFLMAYDGPNQTNAIYQWSGGDRPRFNRVDDATAERIVRQERPEYADEPDELPDRSQRPRDGWTRVGASRCRLSSPPI